MKNEKKKIILAFSHYSPYEDFENILEKENFDVKTVSRGEEVIEKITSEPPDLIIADTDLPDLNAFDILKFLRESGKLKEIPLVVYSALGSPEHREKAMDHEAKDFIPGYEDSYEQIVLKIKAHLGEQKEYIINIAEDLDNVKRMARDLGYKGELECPHCKETLHLRLLRNLSLGRNVFKASLVCPLCNFPYSK